jgi:uncharacterized membrane protein HdeD (DUF308 family)
MKPATILGILLIILGIFALATGGFSFKERKRVADVGPIHAEKDTTHSVPLPPVLGGIALVGGIVLVALSTRSSRK